MKTQEHQCDRVCPVFTNNPRPPCPVLPCGPLVLSNFIASFYKNSAKPNSFPQSSPKSVHPLGPWHINRTQEQAASIGKRAGAIHTLPPVSALWMFPDPFMVSGCICSLWALAEMKLCRTPPALTFANHIAYSRLGCHSAGKRMLEGKPKTSRK